MIWRCTVCNIEGPAESFPTRTTPSHICPILKFQTTVGNKRLACPNCNGWLTPKPFSEIFEEAFEHELASSDASEARPRGTSTGAAAASVLVAAASPSPTVEARA